jgi:transposase-like protein
MTKPTVFSKEIKQSAVREFLETNNVAAVAKKYGVSIKTIYNWKRTFHDLPLCQSPNDINALKKKLEDSELENLVLRELLKKTYQVMKID